MKRFVLSLTLACALSVTALAGEISTTGAPAPQPPGEVSTTDAPGQIPTDGSASPGEIPSLGIVLTILDLVF